MAGMVTRQSKDLSGMHRGTEVFCTVIFQAIEGAAAWDALGIWQALAAREAKRARCQGKGQAQSGKGQNAAGVTNCIYSI